MSFQRNDYLSLNRGGTPATAGGATGTYYVEQVKGLEKILGIPLLTADLGGVAPAAPGPHAYIDDAANPDVLMIWDSSANAYVPVLSASTAAQAIAGTDATTFITPATLHSVLADKSLGFTATQAAAQTVAASVVVQMTGLVPSRNDFGAAAFDGATFTVPAGKAGWYLIAGVAGLVGPLTVMTSMIYAGAGMLSLNSDSGAAGNSVQNNTTVGFAYLNDGDTVYLAGFHMSGAPKSSAPTLVRLQIVRLS